MTTCKPIVGSLIMVCCFENIILVPQRRVGVLQGFIDMIAKRIARFHSSGISAKGNVHADRTLSSP